MLKWIKDDMLPDSAVHTCTKNIYMMIMEIDEDFHLLSADIDGRQLKLDKSELQQLGGDLSKFIDGWISKKNSKFIQPSDQTMYMIQSSEKGE